MKFEVEVECTPAEARHFLGLPDLTPLHEEWITRMKGFAFEGLASEEWQKLLKAWTSGMPGLTQGMENWQKMFWAAAQAKGNDKKE
ncbi:MAG: DUF6489 family protein [Sphingomonadaceae bacterium]